ncbi:COMMD10 [Branchiostoma lanceolatum]|uniref:COMMD10 protein n=1 Tax=Branchiostoma lanceolatum TaxID=7740 RepID=A0A8K0EKX3_BRALA|nr:COMMD10 [Branchiostoma lanceolatum]
MERKSRYKACRRDCKHQVVNKSLAGQRLKVDKMALMFTATANIKKAVSLINQLDVAKFPRLLQRILQKLHLRDDRSFSEEEEEMLQQALGLQGADLQLVLETTAFVLEQAAYHSAKPAVLEEQLKNIQLEEDKVSVFVKAWAAGGKEVIMKLRKRTLAPDQLESVNWRLNLQMAQASQTKMKLPNAMFELGVRHDDDLETIQEQLDSLGS